MSLTRGSASFQDAYSCRDAAALGSGLQRPSGATVEGRVADTRAHRTALSDVPAMHQGRQGHAARSVYAAGGMLRCGRTLARSARTCAVRAVCARTRRPEIANPGCPGRFCPSGPCPARLVPVRPDVTTPALPRAALRTGPANASRPCKLFILLHSAVAAPRNGPVISHST